MSKKYSNQEITKALWALGAIDCDETFGLNEEGYINLFEVAADENRDFRYVTLRDLNRLEVRAQQYLDTNGNVAPSSGKSKGMNGQGFTPLHL